MYKQIKVIPRNNPNKKLKTQFAKPVFIISSHEADLDYYDHDGFDKNCYEHYCYEAHRDLKRSYGKKRSAATMKQNFAQRMGHVLDYPEYHFGRNKPCKHVYEAVDSKSEAYKLADNWKGNSKRKKQWYK